VQLQRLVKSTCAVAGAVLEIARGVPWLLLRQAGGASRLTSR